jgi:hypothetical protein
MLHCLKIQVTPLNVALPEDAGNTTQCSLEQTEVLSQCKASFLQNANLYTAVSNTNRIQDFRPLLLLQNPSLHVCEMMIIKFGQVSQKEVFLPIPVIF